MALTTCPECKNSVSTSAKTCPNCGKKLKRSSFVVPGLLMIFLMIIFLPSIDRYSPDANTPLTPEQISEDRKIKEDAEKRSLGLKWGYLESDDKMTKGKISTAWINSTNQIQFDAPYQGLQRATLNLRKHPRFGKNVFLSIEKGQFLCSINGCNIQIRFDDGKPLTFSASEPESHSSTVLFINNHDKFLVNTRKASRVFIEAGFFREGNRVFEFDVSDLNWP